MQRHSGGKRFGVIWETNSWEKEEEEQNLYDPGDIGGVPIGWVLPHYAMKEPRFHEQGEEAGNPI